MLFLHHVKSTEWREILWKSEWFERGWTLQERLAPRNVIFASGDWVKIGTKRDTLVRDIITRATRIPSAVLTGQLRLAGVPIA